jgi:hypothetical protein
MDRLSTNCDQELAEIIFEPPVFKGFYAQISIFTKEIEERAALIKTLMAELYTDDKTED